MPHRNEARIIKERNCWQRRTAVEKCLFALCLLAAIALIALGISLYVLNVHTERNYRNAVRAEALRKSVTTTTTTTTTTSEPLIGVENPDIDELAEQTTQYDPSTEHDVCDTDGCKKAAAKVIESIDESVDPCSNFYKFACGKFVKNTPIPEDKVTVDSFSIVRDLVQDQLRTIINEKSDPRESKPFRLAKDYNAACLNKEVIEQRGIKPLADLLEAFGGWPVIKGDSWMEHNWFWIEVIKKFRRMGLSTNIVFTTYVSTDLKNSIGRVLSIDQTSLGLEREFLVKGIDEPLVQAYLNFMVDNAVIFGANRTAAEKELKEALEFEIQLAKISLPKEERRNATALYNPTTIDKLQESYPYLNWDDYINALLPQDLTVYGNETVINAVPEFFKQLETVLSSTSKRTVANYFLWRIVLATSGTLTNQLRQRKLEYFKAVYGLQGEEARWKECVQFTSISLPISVGALYVRKYFNETSKKVADELVDDIRNEFLDILYNVPWMDDETRGEAVKKANAITAHIGYPSELADNNNLEEFFRDLEIAPDNLLLNTLRLSVFDDDYTFGQLRKPVNKTDWVTHSKPALVNALYSSLENSIQFPAAIWQDRFFAPDRPRYMNYAAIGQIIGHEITHGFDDRGRQFDLDGNLAEWWLEETRNQFLEKAQCIIDQYGNYTDSLTNLTLNGISTQGENIADNGGVKEAYVAYNNWVDSNAPEGILPGLKYSQKQLFWISFAQTWCAVSRPEYNKNKVVTAFHAPNEFRVIGTLHNMKEFAYDFNCPVGTKMNPSKKCEVW